MEKTQFVGHLDNGLGRVNTPQFSPQFGGSSCMSISRLEVVTELLLLRVREPLPDSLGSWPGQDLQIQVLQLPLNFGR